LKSKLLRTDAYFETIKFATDLEDSELKNLEKEIN
jgi:hypothetical protein